MNPYVIRAAHRGDLDGFKELRALAGPGFTSFMVDDSALEARLAHAESSFAANPAAPNDERYLLALEEIGGRAVAGSVGLKAKVGDMPPFFNFRVLKIAQASASVDRRFDMDVLILVNEFANCSEVGSLFLRPEHRAGGLGRSLAQARYMLMAAEPHRFCERVVSELRGVVSAEGRSPFWDHLGAHFFKMSFREADQRSASGDSQFILDLMPKYPIYADLLPDEARDAIGRTHEDGRGARRLLEWEGFHFDNVVDIFDAGPLLSVSRDAIRTVRETQRKRLKVATHAEGAPRALVATPQVKDFRCAPTHARIHGDHVLVSAETLDALRMEEGAEALVWIDDAA